MRDTFLYTISHGHALYLRIYSVLRIGYTYLIQMFVAIMTNPNI